MKIAKTVSIALSLLFAVSASVLATTPIPINPDGPGPDPTITVGSLGWNNGFAISVNAVPAVVGSTITTFSHGALANFNDSLGNPIGGLGLNSRYEWTYVLGLTETVFALTGSCPSGSPSPCTETLRATAGATNFFNVYYDPSRNANNLAGTGFNDGTLILSGTFLPYNPSTGVGASVFTATGFGGDLDQFGTNDYAGVFTVAGNGSFNLLAAVTFANSSFFTSAPSLISVTANGFTNLPFLQTNPSSCYFNGATLTSAVGPNDAGGPCLVNTVGAINGVSGPNVAFETRATSAFNAIAVPEPASVALLGIGLVALASIGRRRKDGSR